MLALVSGKTERRIPRGLHALIFKLLKSMVFYGNGVFYPDASIQEMGGSRMGVDIETSVVSSFCQCWDVPNVFVTDGACFPSIGYQNHMLTIMALTVCVRENILQQWN